MKRILELIRLVFAGGVALLYLVAVGFKIWEQAHGRTFDLPVDSLVLVAVVGFLFGPEIIDRARGGRKS